MENPSQTKDREDLVTVAEPALVGHVSERAPKKKLVILAKYFPGDQAGAKAGGIETDTLAVAEALKDDFDITVLAHSTDRLTTEERWDGFSVIRSATEAVILSQPISLSHFLKMRRLDADVLHLHAPNHWASLVAFLMMKPGTRLVITHHMEVQGRRWMQQLVSPIYRALARKAKVVIVSAPTNLTNSRDLPKPLKHVEIVPYGLDPVDYEIDAEVRQAAKDLRASLGVTGPVVGFIGRAVAYKGLPVLLEALRDQPDIGCLVVGDGPLTAGLKAQAEADGMAHRVHFLGRLPDGRAKLVALAAMDCFVLPSATPAEAFAIVQVEAQLCGLPVIASGLPTGVSDVTIDNLTGLHFTPNDRADLAAKMRILADDPERARAMGEAGRQRALDHYSAQKHRNTILRIFREASA